MTAQSEIPRNRFFSERKDSLKSSDEWFKVQLRDKKSAFVEGRKIDYVDLSPDAAHKKNDIPNVPVLLATGWSENPDSINSAMFALVKSGYRVISPIHSRNEEEGLESTEYNKYEERKAQTLHDTKVAAGCPVVRLFARSEGAINGVLMARSYPGEVLDMVLESPAGMVPVRNMAFLLGRVGKSIASATWQTALHPGRNFKPVNNVMQETIGYMRNNRLLTLLEVHAISQSDILPWLEELYFKNGIRSIVIPGVEDKFFPVREISDRLLYKDKEKRIKRSEKEIFVAGFLTIGGEDSMLGDHLAIHTNPEEIIKVVDWSFRAHERQRKEGLTGKNRKSSKRL